MPDQGLARTDIRPNDIGLVRPSSLTPRETVFILVLVLKVFHDIEQVSSRVVIRFYIDMPFHVDLLGQPVCNILMRFSGSELRDDLPVVAVLRDCLEDRIGPTTRLLEILVRGLQTNVCVGELLFFAFEPRFILAECFNLLDEIVFVRFDVRFVSTGELALLTPAARLRPLTVTLRRKTTISQSGTAWSGYRRAPPIDARSLAYLLPGVPALGAGHGRNLAWVSPPSAGLTTTASDTADASGAALAGTGLFARDGRLRR